MLLFSHAIWFAAKVAHPISEFLTLDKVVGPAEEEGLAVVMLVLVSVAAGFVARTTLGRNLMRWSENSLLGGLPQYRLVKSVAEGLAQIENAEDLKPAPQAPTPMSGNVMYLPAERVGLLSNTMVEPMSIVKRMGMGSAKALHGTDLALLRTT